MKQIYIFYQNYYCVQDLLKGLSDVRNALIITKLRHEHLYQLDNGDIWRIREIKNINSITGLHWDKAYVEYSITQDFPEVIEYIKYKNNNYEIF